MQHTEKAQHACSSTNHGGVPLKQCLQVEYLQWHSSVWCRYGDPNTLTLNPKTLKCQAGWAPAPAGRRSMMTQEGMAVPA